MTVRHAVAWRLTETQPVSLKTQPRSFTTQPDGSRDAGIHSVTILSRRGTSFAHCGLQSAATCDVSYGVFQGRTDGRDKRTTKDETDARAHRRHRQRDGVDRAWSISLDHLRRSGGIRIPIGMAMWAGIFVAVVLAYATAISYSELAKLYPGAGSSYLFAEQAFLNTTHAYRFARVAKFVIGWASHLYYWVYPGVMVATIGVMIGYIVGTLAPERDERRHSGPGVHGTDRDHLRLLRSPISRFGEWSARRWSTSRST